MLGERPYLPHMTADSLDAAPTNIGETHNTIIYKDQSWTAEKCMADLLVSVAAWLVQKGYLTAKHCTIEAGPPITISCTRNQDTPTAESSVSTSVLQGRCT